MKSWHQRLKDGGHDISLSNQSRLEVLWRAYCQLIRHENKAKRLAFVERYIYSADQFENVIYTDECTV